MCSTDFITELNCLQLSKLKNSTLTPNQRDHIVKLRKELYTKLLLDNFSLISDSDISKFKICLESELFTFQEIMTELSLKVVVPTTVNSLFIKKDEIYRLPYLKLISGKKNEDIVRECIDNILGEKYNWRVKSIYYNPQKNNYVIQLANPILTLSFTTILN